MKVSFLGTGLMGRPMAARLLAAGHELTVYNRTREKAVPLQELGARVAKDARDAIEASPWIILMVADAAASHELLFPASFPQPELLGRVIIQMSTISPRQSLELREKVVSRGGEYLEAPVLGSIAEAEKGELVVLVGSNPEQFSPCLPLLQCFSPEPVYVGPVGKAAAFKLALNQLIASLTASFAFSLGIIKKREIDLDLFMGILRRSSLYSPHFDKKLNRMWPGDYTNPTFPLRLLHKDVSLMVAEGQELGLEISGLTGILEIIKRALELGWGEKDYTAITDVVVGLGAKSGGK